MRLAYKLRFIPIIISAVSAFASVFYLVSVSLPYQDPTAAMLQEQSQQISFAENRILFSGLFFAGSIVYCFIIRKLYKNQRI